MRWRALESILKGQVVSGYPPEKPVAPTNERESESPYHPHERHGLPTSSIRSGLECPAAAFVDKHFEKTTAGGTKNRRMRLPL